MQLDEVVTALRDAGTEQNRKTYARHGAKGPMFGVSFATHRALQKKIKRDQPLAEALWATKNFDARIFATHIADPKVCSGRVIGEWVEDVDCYPLADAVSKVASEHPSAMALAAGWRASAAEWTSRVGWQVLTLRAGELDDAAARRVLQEIERTIHAAPNFTRHAMNMTLIAIGVRGDRVKTLAIEASRRIGKVEVDHGETGCKTPDAEAYILKTVTRRSTKALAAAKASAPPKKGVAKKLIAEPVEARRPKKAKAKASSVTARARRATRTP